MQITYWSSMYRIRRQICSFVFFWSSSTFHASKKLHNSLFFQPRFSVVFTALPVLTQYKANPIVRILYSCFYASFWKQSIALLPCILISLTFHVLNHVIHFQNPTCVFWRILYIMKTKWAITRALGWNCGERPLYDPRTPLFRIFFHFSG